MSTQESMDALTLIHMNSAALFNLTNWLSPAYPVGAYTYSHGLEWEIECGRISDQASLADWIRTCLRYGAGRSDAIVLAHTWRAGKDEVALGEVAELAAALAPSAERQLETLKQGEAFARITTAIWPYSLKLPDPLPYPVAVGIWSAQESCPLFETTFLYLNAFANNLISAGLRLVPLGQTDGQRAARALYPDIEAVAAEAINAELDDVGGCSLKADLASMHHETQYTRLFRS